MGKEVKFGLALIAGLLGILGVVIYQRMIHPSDGPLVDLTDKGPVSGSRIFPQPELPPKNGARPQVASNRGNRPVSSDEADQNFGTAAATYDAPTAAESDPFTAPPAAEAPGSLPVGSEPSTNDPFQSPSATSTGTANDDSLNQPTGEAPSGEPAAIDTISGDQQTLSETNSFEMPPADDQPDPLPPAAEPSASKRAERSVLRNRSTANNVNEPAPLPVETNVAPRARIQSPQFADQRGEEVVQWSHRTQPNEPAARPAQWSEPDSEPSNFDSRPLRGRETERREEPARQDDGFRRHEPADDSYSRTAPREEAALGAPKAASNERGRYRILPNDTYWSISEKVYGVGGYYQALYAYNRLEHPGRNRLDVGQSINVPEIDVLEKQYPNLCPKRRSSNVSTYSNVSAGGHQRVGGRGYVVQEGDTLFDIARRELGKAARWNEIYELNRNVLGEDFDYLKPGLELAMPAADKSNTEILTQRGGQTNR